MTGIEQSGLAAWAALEHDEEAIWSAHAGLVPGPSVEELAARLSAAPRAFLPQPGVPLPDVAAVARDVFEDTPDRGAAAVAAARLIAGHGDRARTGALLGMWLFASPDLVGPLSAPLRTDRAARALQALALRLAGIRDPSAWVSDAERREEAVRLLLLWAGMLPAGESVADARTRFDLLDSVQRDA
ncbi:hypothetical protein, partial [Microbacterium sp.]|uniref:hypothetical protein n=1 Tax=Microbacterium sp. TaxID=51671 RepID=UPI002810DE38